MKTRAIAALRRKLAADQPTCGLWITLEAPAMTEMAVALGLDWVVIDTEHSALDWRDIAGHLRAAVRSETVAFVRLAEHSTAGIKRALDLGADGIAIPGIETPEQLAAIVRDCRYPPAGNRGVGADRSTAWGQALVEHTSTANEHVLVLPILESPAAKQHVDALCAVDGVEMFYFGPADYSAAAGHLGQWEGAGVAEDLLQMLNVLRRAGKHAGVLGTAPDDLLRRREQGFRLLGLGTDASLTVRALRESLRALGADRIPAASLDPRDALRVAAPLARVPDDVRPDRPEAVTTVGAGVSVPLEVGVDCELLAGAATQARGLATGLVALQPRAALAYHVHPCTESITVLEGQLTVAVEGRSYALEAGDNIVVPRWLPHRVDNTSPECSTRIHVAFAMSSPERQPVDCRIPERSMPRDSVGYPGAERVTRLRTARRYSAGPNTEFVDYFNETLMPGIEMSGGWGRFHQGGRLPAHFHDFDESICIIEGEAVCRVEARRYALSGGATAFVPRGRPHYFVNESPDTMEMIWVYAGPRPERIVVSDDCLLGEKP